MVDFQPDRLRRRMKAVVALKEGGISDKLRQMFCWFKKQAAHKASLFLFFITERKNIRCSLCVNLTNQLAQYASHLLCFYVVGLLIFKDELKCSRVAQKCVTGEIDTNTPNESRKSC